MGHQTVKVFSCSDAAPPEESEQTPPTPASRELPAGIDSQQRGLILRTLCIYNSLMDVWIQSVRRMLCAIPVVLPALDSYSLSPEVGG